VGDVTQQNLYNDMDNGYLFPPISSLSPSSGWNGGVNLTTLRLLEDRAYGNYWLLVNNSPVADWAPRLTLNTTVSGTGTGLSKFPYLRDTRRGIGLDGFRLYYAPLDYNNASEPRAGFRFNDTVALGNYNDDTHKMGICNYPPYVYVHDTKPYYIPFRALTVDGAPNLLVAGKTMSQTFHANSATRLHPSEWTSGVAAGGSAVFMLNNGFTSTADVYSKGIPALQAFLNSSAVGQPLEWDLGGKPDVPIGYVCGIGAGGHYCVSVDHTEGNQTLHANSTCDGACTALAADQWLANDDFWDVVGDSIVATTSTVLKKSIANSNFLPPAELLPVSPGFKCKLVFSGVWEGYYLCAVSA